MEFGLELNDEHLIVTRARPVVARVLSRYGRGHALTEEDAEDIAAVVELRLIEKVRRVAAGIDAPLESLDSYVAKVAFNVVHDHLRSRYPEKTRLKNRLRYVLTHDPRLGLWPFGDGWACGLRDAPQSAVAGAVLLDAGRVTDAMRDDRRPAEALVAILTAAGGAVSFDALTAFTASLWNVTDAPPVELARIQPQQQPAAADTVETRESLGILWNEIRQLRPMQRKALLLNLREERDLDAVGLLILTGTATSAELAAALEMSHEELAALWNELPLDDLRIAGMLGITRQQVINLRKAARARLRRRTEPR